MKTKSIIWKGLVMLLITIGIGCSDSDVNGNAQFRLKLVDAPGDYLEVNVEITDVQYNQTDNEEGWQSFDAPEGEDYPLEVDLTELVAGNELILTDQVVPSGMMKQIRLILGENNYLIIEGETEAVPLKTPSAQQSGLKLKLNEELEPGFSYTYILDWDVQKSIIKAGNSGNYNLKPVIKMSAEVNSGSISGSVFEVVETVDTPIEWQVIELSDTMESWTTTTNEQGLFLFQGVDPSGNYTIKVVREGYVDVELGGISVTAGQETVIDPIELIKI